MLSTNTNQGAMVQSELVSPPAGFWFDENPAPLVWTDSTLLAEALNAEAAEPDPDRGALLDRLAGAHAKNALVRANLAACAFYGFAEDDLKAAWPQISANAFNMVSAREVFRAFAQGDEGFSWRFQHVRPDGAIRYGVLKLRPLPQAEPGATRQWANLITDITEQRRESDIWFETNPIPTIEYDMMEMAGSIKAFLATGPAPSELRAGIDSAHDFIRIRRVNPAAEKLFKRSEAELIGDPFLTVSGQNRIDAVDAWIESLRRKSLQRPWLSPVELPDGSARHVIHWSRPWPGHEEDWSRTLVHFIDVTASRTAELQAISEAEAAGRLAAAHFSQSPLALFETNLGWLREVLRRAQALGQAPSVWGKTNPTTLVELMGHAQIGKANAAALKLFAGSLGDLQRRQKEIFSADFVAAALEGLDNANQDFPLPDQMTFRGKAQTCDGRLVECVVVSTALPGAEADWSRCSTAFLDVTDLRATERELEAARAASAAKSRFLATMSHELRTPLNAVIGYSELMREEILEGGTVDARDCEKINRSARHLLGLINDVLDLAKIEADKLEVVLGETSLVELLQEVADLAAPLSARNGNAFALEIDPSFGTIITDAQRLRQCVFNLVSNACKFTQAGRITVSARPVQHDGALGIAISVSDTGIGLSPEQQARLFSEFTQVDDSLSRRAEGTGLGLAITKKLLYLLGGSIRVESALGAGSTFTIHLRQHCRDDAGRSFKAA
ncbi:MAG: ATP-binding protein [Hyphomonadaceae bacterium]|jgi:nitrogen-specific signal transduction histidine kinase